VFVKLNRLTQGFFLRHPLILLIPLSVIPVVFKRESSDFTFFMDSGLEIAGMTLGLF